MIFIKSKINSRGNLSMNTRRSFIKTSSVASAVLLPGNISRLWGGKKTSIAEPSFDEANVKPLIDAAMNKGKALGADYSDVRLVHNFEVRISNSNISYGESISAGLRALIDGCWGFAAGNVWNQTEMVRLANEAAEQARVIAKVRKKRSELSPLAQTANGSWIMPIELDPIGLNPDEIVVQGNALKSYASNYLQYKGASLIGYEFKCTGMKQVKYFGSTDDAFCFQTLYNTFGIIRLAIRYKNIDVQVPLETLTPAGVGMERFLKSDVRIDLKKLIDETLFDIDLPFKPLDVGRYDIVVDSNSTGDLVGKTIGIATELDRVMGYEANAGGTSYIKDPDTEYLALEMGSNLLNVSANRSQIGAAATVKWDDEGVQPRDFSIVKDGILSGFANGRESSTWLRNHVMESNGCISVGSEPVDILGSGGAVNVPLIHVPNLIMEADDSNEDFDSMIAGLEKGIAFKGMQNLMDFQQLNGLGFGKAYEVKAGKITARLGNAGVLFRALELWKSLKSIGGKSSVTTYGKVAEKGEPSQTVYYSVSAPPVLFKEATIVDTIRRG